jgi:Rrf2 family protein
MDNEQMRVSLKADYAIRASLVLASSSTGPVKVESIARAQGIPLKFLSNIMTELKLAQIVRSHRGTEGGYELARPASVTTLADVIRAVEGPLANVHDLRPEELEYPKPAESLRLIWVAVRASLRSVLEAVTLADLLEGTIPSSVAVLTQQKDAWLSR